jgi:hypothetical protein
VRDNGRFWVLNATFRQREADGRNGWRVDDARFSAGDVIYGQPIDGWSFCSEIGAIDVLFP